MGSDFEEAVCWAHLNHKFHIDSPVFESLIEHFGSVRAAMEVPGIDLESVAGLDPRLAEAIAGALTEISGMAAQLEDLRVRGFKIITSASSNYPARLRLAENPPPVLYQLGELRTQDDIAAAIIGSRDCSETSGKQAHEYAGYMAENGLTIVSGYASGIDINGHRGALEAGGRTIIIPGCGVDRFDLAPLGPAGIHSFDDLTENAVLISEQPPDAEWSWPACRDRNRLVAAWACALLVVEAQLQSSTLDTVLKAQRLARPIFALGSDSETERMSGNQMLLEQGAGRIESRDDLWALIDEVRPG